MPEINIASFNDVTIGVLKKINISGKDLLMTRIDDQVYVLDDACTHKGCSLSGEGFLDGQKIVCGCHGAMFDVSSGKVLALPAVNDLKSYQVTIKNGDIFINI
jgi:nitrite reductase/ring-hydroxylating ferredoxin subunit